MKLHKPIISLIKEYIKDLFFGEYFIKFIIAGSIATMFNYSIFFLLYKLFSVHYIIAAAFGYISGIILSFFINKKWTFISKEKNLKQLAKYFSVFILSLIIGLFFLNIEVTFLNLDPILANLIMICLTTLFNYLGTRYIVFAK